MKTLYFLIGAPGVGKTTFLEKSSEELKKIAGVNLQNYVISPDSVRMMVSSPEAKPDGTFGISQKNESFVWEFIRNVLDKKAENGELIIVDATHSRTKAISAYKKYSDMGYRIVGIDLASGLDIDVILERNANRDPLKFVPEDVIRSMHERIKTLEIPSWVEVIKPEEFVEHFNNIVFNFDNFEKLLVIGDIHGCSREFKTVIESFDIDIEKEDKSRAIVLVGDYFDRGYDVIETFKMIQKLQKTHWVLPLIGNHEEPLRYYKEFLNTMVQDFQDFIKTDIAKSVASLNELDSVIEQLDKFEEEIVSSRINANVFQKIVNYIDELLVGNTEKSILDNIELTRAQSFELKDKLKEEALGNIEEEGLNILLKFQTSSYKHWDAFIEKIRPYEKTFNFVKTWVYAYKIPGFLVKDPITKVNKLKRTSTFTVKLFALSDIKYTEVMAFYKKLAQFCYVDFHGQRILVTHGGLVDLPTKATPTADMIRGVGGYEDAELCMKTFHKKHPDVIQVHGHRNMSNLPIEVTKNTFNVNGDVDLGMKAVEFVKNETFEMLEVEPKPETIEFFRGVQLKRAQKFKAKKLSAEEEGNGLLNLFQDHVHVDVKKLPGNIAAINFTREAFERGAWDNITIKARGLFVDISSGEEKAIKVIARGYEKFFNLGEKHGFELRDIRDLAYPIKAYEKANGYLGLLSVDNRDPNNPEWFIASKTTTEGDYAKTFKKMIQPHLNDNLMQKMIKSNITLVFEVIEPFFDPHIERYASSELVLLDAIKNQLDFEKLPYEELQSFIDIMVDPSIIRVKHFAKTCEKFNDFWILVEKENTRNLLDRDGIEGFVFEDGSNPPNIFKLKTKWYSFWKFMRGMKIRIEKRIHVNYETTGEYKLDKSDSIKLKESLHREEDFIIFNFMVSLAEENFDNFQLMDIIQIREEFHIRKKG